MDEEREKRIAELTEELGKIQFEKITQREAIVKEIEILTRLQLEAEKADVSRINSNIQNDIQEERLALDSERLKADKADSRRRLAGDIIKTVGSLVGSFGLAILSFKGEWLQNILRDRTLWDLAKSLKPRH